MKLAAAPSAAVIEGCLHQRPADPPPAELRADKHLGNLGLVVGARHIGYGSQHQQPGGLAVPLGQEGGFQALHLGHAPG
jgi:hypothetical protein